MPLDERFGSDNARRRVERPPITHRSLQAHHIREPARSSPSSSSSAPAPHHVSGHLLGTNGRITRAAEFVPGLNRGIQSLHKKHGHLDAFERARRRDPVGADGYLTRIGEAIPGINDGIHALHLRAGHIDQADRVRARTVQGLFSKDGAVTKMVEMVPGLNLVAAGVHELRGNEVEAHRAWALRDNWSSFRDHDGALIRLAELMPGADVMAFAAHVNSGRFAQALRSVVKMPWLEVRIVKVEVEFSAWSAREIALVEFDIEGVSINPKTGPILLGALVDVALHMMGVSRSQEGLRDPVEESVKKAANAFLTNFINLRLVDLQQLVRSLLSQAENWLHHQHWHYELAPWWDLKQKLIGGLFGFLPDAVPEPSSSFFVNLREACLGLALTHGALPAVEPLRPLRDKHVPEAAGAVSCLSFLGCCLGAHASWFCGLGCFAGAAAAAAQVGRVAAGRALEWLGDFNHEARKPISGPGPPVLEPYQTGVGVVVAVDEDQVGALSTATWEYLSRTLLARRLLCRRILHLVVRCLRHLASHQGGSALPLAVGLQIPAATVCSRRNNGPLDLSLPAIQLLLLLDIGFGRRRPYVQRARVAARDELLHEILHSVCEQLMSQDLRSLAPCLADFSEPFGLSFDVNLDWPQPNQPRLDVQNLFLKMFLPE